MSYEPTNWKSGDVVTSAKLNKLENGVANAGGGISVVEFEFDTTNEKYVSVRTTESILAELQAGIPQVWLFKGIEDTGWPIMHNSWTLVYGLTISNSQTRSYIISVATELGAINAQDPDFGGEHVVVSLYTD